MNPEPPRRPFHPTRVTAGWVVKVVLICAAVSGTVGGMLLSVGKSVPWIHLFLVALGAAAVLRLVQAVRGPDVGVPEPLRPRAETLRSERPFAEVSRWENRLSWTYGDVERFDLSVRPRLRELIDERLRQKHGVRIDTDPTRARELLGDPLWSLLHDMSLRGPGAQTPSPRQLAWYLTRIEEI